MYYKLRDLAERYQCGIPTVQGWIMSGLLPAVNVAPVSSKRKHYRVTEAGLAAFEKARGVNNHAPQPGLRPMSTITEFV